MRGDQTNNLRRSAARVAVTEFLSHRDYLQAIYVAAKSDATAYSYLRFAAELGFSATNVMRLIIAGQRPLTSKAASRIAKALGLHGANLRYWTALVRYANARLPAEREALFRQLMSHKSRATPAALDPVQAEYFSEWYHPVIREMVGLADFNGEPEWIKRRLAFPLRLEQIKRSLELLEKLEVIRRGADGRYERGANIVTSHDVDSMAIVRYHQKLIEIGRESITRVDEQDRDIQAVTVSLPRDAVAVLKGRIQELINAALALEAASVGDIASHDEPVAAGEAARKTRRSATVQEVVQLNVQLFPFTQRPAGKGKES